MKEKCDAGPAVEARQRLMEAALQLIWCSGYGTTTVDAICERAKVKKGSFYYFFASKSDLAVAALDADCAAKRPDLDAIFSPTVPVLERLDRFFDLIYRRQCEWKEKCGKVLGCPLFTLGSEISTQNQEIRKKIEETLGVYIKYFESVVRDAVAGGLIAKCDVPRKAQCLFCFFEGALGQARIRNDLEGLKGLFPGALDVLGIKRETPVLL